ncbi:MAG: hypothetical protein AB7W59_03330 [Acidimicrobiia bacterium]
MRGIREYLTAIVDERRDEIGDVATRYVCNADLVLQLGVGMPAVDRLPAGMPLGPMGQCFATAGTIAVAPRCRFTYVEGFAQPLAGRPPVLHAWLMTVDGRAVDLTWGQRRPAAAYLGVPFSRDYLVVHILRTRRWGLLDDGQGEPLIDVEPADYLAHCYGRAVA